MTDENDGPRIIGHVVVDPSGDVLGWGGNRRQAIANAAAHSHLSDADIRGRLGGEWGHFPATRRLLEQLNHAGRVGDGPSAFGDWTTVSVVGGDGDIYADVRGNPDGERADDDVAPDDVIGTAVVDWRRMRLVGLGANPDGAIANAGRHDGGEAHVREQIESGDYGLFAASRALADAVDASGGGVGAVVLRATPAAGGRRLAFPAPGAAPGDDRDPDGDGTDFLDDIIEMGSFGHLIAATALDASMGNDPDPVDVVARVDGVDRRPDIHGARATYAAAGQAAVDRHNDRTVGTDPDADPRAVAFLAGATGGQDCDVCICGVDDWRLIVRAYELARRAVGAVRGSIELGDVVADPYLSRSGVVDCRPGYCTGEGGFDDDLAGV